MARVCKQTHLLIKPKTADFLPNKANLRVLTVNCCTVKEPKSEFIAALFYAKQLCSVFTQMDSHSLARLRRQFKHSIPELP